MSHARSPWLPPAAGRNSPPGHGHAGAFCDDPHAAFATTAPDVAVAPGPVAGPAQDSTYARMLAEHRSVFEVLAALQPQVEAAALVIARSLHTGHKFLLCGNGGSAADSQHIAAELTGRFVHDRRPLAALALTTDTSALTCIANDYAFDQVFVRQVQALGRPGDCLLAISTSGRSANVLAAVEAAALLGLTTIALTGGDGGPLRQRCDHALVVPSRTTARIQEAHIFIGHGLCALVEEALGLA
jgi:D-sedoheptulose 7-phosphate isomerase